MEKKTCDECGLPFEPIDEHQTICDDCLDIMDSEDEDENELEQ